MIKNWKQQCLGLVLGGLLLGGCYPSENLVTEDLDVVVTVYDTDVDFSQFQTYAMPDTIVQIGDPSSDTYIDLDLTRAEMDFILNLVRNNMAALGYTDVSEPNATDTLTVEPDVGMFVEILAERHVVIRVSPGWGWGWWGGWPGWGWGPGWGGWYPPRVSGQTYPLGTVLVNYIDVDGIVQGDSLKYVPTPWLGVANGLLFRTNTPQDRITRNIDQMFDQSQYLRTGN